MLYLVNRFISFMHGAFSPTSEMNWKTERHHHHHHSAEELMGWQRHERQCWQCWRFCEKRQAENDKLKAKIKVKGVSHITDRGGLARRIILRDPGPVQILNGDRVDHCRHICGCHHRIVLQQTDNVQLNKGDEVLRGCRRSNCAEKNPNYILTFFKNPKLWSRRKNWLK